jgi:hypothetical protein
MVNGNDPKKDCRLSKYIVVLTLRKIMNITKREVKEFLTLY